MADGAKMKTTQHTPIYRNGQHEQPVTVVLDDGTVIDYVLCFGKSPTQKQIDARVLEVVAKHQNKLADEPEEMVPVSEIEKVLKEKKLITADKKWADVKIMNTVEATDNRMK